MELKQYVLPALLSYHPSSITIEYVFFLYLYLLDKGGYVFGSIGLSVCLWTTFSKRYERI